MIQSLPSRAPRLLRTATQFLRQLPEPMRQGVSIRDYHLTVLGKEEAICGSTSLRPTGRTRLAPDSIQLTIRL
jgi:hypothetical protein